MTGDGRSWRGDYAWRAADPPEAKVFLDVCIPNGRWIRINQSQVTNVESLSDSRRAGSPGRGVLFARKCPEMLQRTCAKAGFLLKFDKLRPGKESLVGLIEMCSRRYSPEILAGPDRRIAGKVIYKTGSGAARKGWQIESEVWERRIGMDRRIVSPPDDRVYASGAKQAAAGSSW